MSDATGDSLALPEKIVAIHHALSAAELPHAFGGALALAWCTSQARGTIDIDVNVFVAGDEADTVLGALPEGVEARTRDRGRLIREGQVRLWWGHAPVDLFLNTTDFHVDAAQRCRWETFMGEPLPFLACNDLAVFKAFFNRTKDWADLEEMRTAGTLDLPRVSSVLAHYLGEGDERIRHLAALEDIASDAP